MLCSICQKNEAVLCYREIVNGVKSEKFLCADCAATYTSITTDALQTSPASLLAGLLSEVLGQAATAREEDVKKTNLACPHCGMTYNEFLKFSRFGCGDCVHTFGFLLDDYLKKIQAGCEHNGKVYCGRETVHIPEIDLTMFSPEVVPEVVVNVPERVLTEEDELRERLSAAIAAEEFEEAARIRDQIRVLKEREAQTDGTLV